LAFRGAWLQNLQEVFFPKRKIIAVLLIFCFLLLVFFLSSRNATYSFRTISSDISKIPFYIVTAVSGEVRAILFFHRDYWDNLKLIRDNETLKQELLRLSGVTLENERLKGLLELRQGLSYGTVARLFWARILTVFALIYCLIKEAPMV